MRCMWVMADRNALAATTIAVLFRGIAVSSRRSCACTLETFVGGPGCPDSGYAAIDRAVTLAVLLVVARTWLSIRVELVSGRGEVFWPRLGECLLRLVLTASVSSLM